MCSMICHVWPSLEPSRSAFPNAYHIRIIQTDTEDTKSSMLCCQEQGMPRCPSTIRTTCVVGTRSWGFLCQVSLAQLRVSTCSEVIDVKKNNYYFLKHPVVMLHLPLLHPSVHLCICHPVHPALTQLIDETLPPDVFSVCPARGRAPACGSFVPV